MPGKPRSSDEQIFVANTSGFINMDGQDYQIIRRVTRVRGTSAIYKRAPKLFDPIDVDFEDAEAATAAPGEVRG